MTRIWEASVVAGVPGQEKGRADANTDFRACLPKLMAFLSSHSVFSCFLFCPYSDFPVSKMFSIAVSLPIQDIIKVRHRIWFSCLANSLKTKKIKMLKIDGKKNSFPHHLHLVQLTVYYMHCVIFVCGWVVLTEKKKSYPWTGKLRSLIKHCIW